MADLTQTDIDVILQYSGMKFSDMASDFVKDLKFGRKCTVENRSNLMLLSIYLEVLENYRPLNDTEVLSTGSLTISNVYASNAIIFYVDYIPITATINIASTDIPTATTAIVNAINSYSDDYTATSSGAGSVTITGPCTNGELTFTSSGGSSNPVITGSGMTGGECVVSEDDNCFTEEEIKTIIEKISKLTDLCFQAPGTSYFPAE